MMMEMMNAVDFIKRKVLIGNQWATRAQFSNEQSNEFCWLISDEFVELERERERASQVKFKVRKIAI